MITSIAAFPTTAATNSQLQQQQQQQVEGDGGEPAGEATPEEPPNILLIISDGQPFYSTKYTAAILNEIFTKGTMFSDAFLTTSLCCPSRASILTGLYAHNHTAISNANSDPLTNTTFFQAIDTAISTTKQPWSANI